MNHLDSLIRVVKRGTRSGDFVSGTLIYPMLYIKKDCSIIVLWEQIKLGGPNTWPHNDRE